MKKLSAVLSTVAAIAFGSTLCMPLTAAQTAATEQTSRIVPVSKVKWTPLNPLRGDASPRAGTLWGDADRKGPVATGFLVKFTKGFSSPPHIHNVTYRGVVIHGLVHNDDPDAAKMWMPAGSFWTQPAGEVHITAAKAESNMAYIEIDRGPYLVKPPKERFDRGERPINVDASNIVWVDPTGVAAASNAPKVAYLWGEPRSRQLRGTLVKLPTGFMGKISTEGDAFRAVVIQGNVNHLEADSKPLLPGSYFGSKGKHVQPISSLAGESILYVRTNGAFEIIPDRG